MAATVSSSGDLDSPLVAVDVRMWRHSGIGRYIREVVPRVAASLPDVRWRFVGPPPGAWRHGVAGAEDFACDWPVYSWREHCAGLPGMKGADVCWVPHYNVTPGRRGRLVVTLHDLLPLRYAEGWRGRVRRLVVRRYLNRAEKAVRVLTVSEFTAGEIAALTGIAPERVSPVLLGAGVEWRNPPVVACPSEERAPFFLFVGNLKPHKNLGVLVEAMVRLRPQTRERLVIVGRREGFFTADRRVGAAAAVLGDRVVFTGEIDDRALAGLYARATALVLPSLYEGFGLPVLEAMAVGCPVVLARTASLPEVGGAVAQYFEPSDAESLSRLLVSIAADTSLQAELRQAGRTRAAAFTWERTATQTAAILRDVLSTA